MTKISDEAKKQAEYNAFCDSEAIAWGFKDYADMQRWIEKTKKKDKEFDRALKEFARALAGITEQARKTK